MRALPPPNSSTSTTSRPLDCATRSTISRIRSKPAAIVASCNHPAIEHKPPIRLSLPPGVADHQRIKGGNKKWARAHRCASPDTSGSVVTPGGSDQNPQNTTVLLLIYPGNGQNSSGYPPITRDAPRGLLNRYRNSTMSDY